MASCSAPANVQNVPWCWVSFLMAAAEYKAGRLSARKNSFLTLRSINVHCLRICPKKCRTKNLSSACTEKYNRYFSCSTKAACIIRLNNDHKILCTTSKHFAQWIPFLSHRGSTTTLSVVLNSYFIVVSAPAIKESLSLSAWLCPISLTR